MAYTKYSLTPADNNAAPPNGAPEGMLPSAVNDTMRDMMSQIRDVGDGIRGGTYTMTAPVITGGSISGATGSFSTLAASGVATFSAGTVSAPAITTTGDTNTGIFFPAADTIAFTEGGVEAMRINSSANVGFGTDSPSSKVEISNSANSATSLTIRNANGGASAAANTRYINSASTHEFGALSAGYGGYGVLTAGAAYVYAGNNQPMQFAVDNSYIAFGTGTGANERMRIDSSGNVGIGTSSPSDKLVVYAASGIVKSAVVSGSVYGWSGYADSGGTFLSGTFSNHPYLFFTNNTERMRIDSSGNLLVGTSSNPVTSGGGYAGAIACAGIATKAGATGAYDGNVFNIRWDGNAGTAQLWIDASNIGTISISSDYRIKRNIETQISPALKRVMALRPVTYQMADYGDLFKASEQVKEGFIAHEVQEVIPSGADGEKDDPVQIQSLRLDAILAVAVKAIQELKTELDSVKAELQTLKS
jgi:hypothetical protein